MMHCNKCTTIEIPANCQLPYKRLEGMREVLFLISQSMMQVSNIDTLVTYPYICGCQRSRTPSLPLAILLPIFASSL